ncbi:ATP-grasp domain-containing protein [Embleya sp. NPDC001921]
MDGTELAPPRVVYSRMSTPQLSCDVEVTLLRHLQAMGVVLVNPIGALPASVDKFWQPQELALAGLPVPDARTYVTAPMHEAIAAGVPEPCVVKAVRGQRGRKVFLARDATILEDVHGSLADEVPYLFQDYVAYSHGRDLRVTVRNGQRGGSAPGTRHPAPGTRRPSPVRWTLGCHCRLPQRRPVHPRRRPRHRQRRRRRHPQQRAAEPHGPARRRRHGQPGCRSVRRCAAGLLGLSANAVAVLDE